MTERIPVTSDGGPLRRMKSGDTLPSWLVPSSGSLLVTKAAHGFVAGQPVRVSVDGSGVSSWTLAQATADLSQIATHFVVAIVDANTFRVSNAGFWAIPALTVYGSLVLGATAGGVVSSVSALPSNVAIQPLGIADATGLHINITSYVRDVTP